MQVGVRELKARLSEFLTLAAQGETITVTDRGRPKAVLGPIGEPDQIAIGIAEGWITPPTGDGAPAFAPVKPVIAEGDGILRELLDDREDRF